MASAVGRAWHSRIRLFVWQYLREILGLGLWTVVNLGAAAIAFLLIFDPHPPTTPFAVTPLRVFAMALISANIQGYWRIWSKASTPADPDLSEDALSIQCVEHEDWHDVSLYLVGKTLAFRCVAGPKEIAECCFRIKDLRINSDDGRQWHPLPGFRPAELAWDDGGKDHAVRAGAERVVLCISYRSRSNMVTLRRSTTDWSLGSQGKYRADIDVEAQGYRVRRLVVEFVPVPLRWSEVQDPDLRRFQPSIQRTEEAPNQ